MTAARLSYQLAPAPVPLLPLDKGLAGPVTAQRWRRSVIAYLALFVLGGALAFLGSPQTAALGLGLVVPGGGFLLHAASPLASTTLHVTLFAGTLLLFALALFLWIATGNLIAPVVVWLGTALAAAWMDHWSGVPYLSLGALCRSNPELINAGDPRVWLPLLIAGLGMVAYWRLRARLPALQADARRINDFLTHARTPVTRDIDTASGIARVHPVERRDLEQHRFMLDRALQPVEEFNGFDRIDEFREAAKRYQCCISSYMQSMHSYLHAPAFHGYQLRAQQNLARKMMDHRVWSYWRLENLWGNLRANPNPLARDNIMYYGWYAAMLGLHQIVTGDEQFSERGAIRLQHPSGEVFVSSFPDLCRIILQNMRGSDFCLFPCEPRWIYPICNNFGALALKCHDRLYGTDYWEQVRGRYRQSLEDEFINLRGRITAIRDYYTGMTLPALTATMADAVTALFMHPVLPDIAARSWNVIRHELIRVADGRTELLTNGWDKIDFGNYRRSFLSTYALIAASAREMGDDEVADGLLRRIDEEFPPQTVAGVRHYAGGSTSAHAVIHAARVLRSNGFYDLVNVGLPDSWRRGPLLEDARYPEVLVAGAVAEGEALKLHLATDAGQRRSELSLARLKPLAEYRVLDSSGNTFRADTRGKATITVELAETIRAFHIVPAH